jgi:hemerythrin-like domain-containing protein
MSVSIPLLRRDHTNFSLILNCMERHVNAVENGSTVPKRFFEAAIQYFREYPRKVHHPKEDLIYSMLIRHHQHDTANVFHVIQDHREIAESLLVLESSFREFDSKDPISVRNLCIDIRNFIAKERKHMEMEDGHLYPMAINFLSPKEWREIDATMGNESDPTFSEDAAAAYDRLIAKILINDSVARGLGDN